MLDLEKLSNHAPKSIDHALENLTDKPTASIGTTLADIWYLVFGKFSFKAEQRRIEQELILNQYKEQLEVSIANIPAEKLLEPSLQITAQALDNSKYCIFEKELRDMFVSLISNSMNRDCSNDIHPSFSEMIKQMSTLDAKIIALFKDISIPGLPVCQYCVKIPGVTSNPISVPEHIFLEIPDSDIPSCSMSLVSLERFGLISISYLSHLSDKTLYEKFSTHSFYKGLQNHCPFVEISIRKGIVILTPLGRSFVRVCIPN